jgi:hypothetical protein
METVGGLGGSPEIKGVEIDKNCIIRVDAFGYVNYWIPVFIPLFIP